MGTRLLGWGWVFIHEAVAPETEFTRSKSVLKERAQAF